MSDAPTIAVKIPWYQRASRWPRYSLEAVIYIGAFVRAIAALWLIPPVATYVGTVVILMTWACVEYLLWKRGIPWVVDGKRYLNRSLGIKPRLELLAVIAALWVPSIVGEPFEADAVLFNISLPRTFVTSTAAQPQAQKDSVPSTPRVFEREQQVLHLVIRNQGPTARHNVQLLVPFVRELTGIAVNAVPARIRDLDQWEQPALLDSARRLEFAPLPEMPARSKVDVFIWGDFYGGFRIPVEIRSDEGLARVEEIGLLTGWELWLARNLQWLAVFCLLVIGIFLLWGLERGGRDAAS